MHTHRRTDGAYTQSFNVRLKLQLGTVRTAMRAPHCSAAARDTCQNVVANCWPLLWRLNLRFWPFWPFFFWRVQLTNCQGSSTHFNSIPTTHSCAATPALQAKVMRLPVQFFFLPLFFRFFFSFNFSARLSCNAWKKCCTLNSLPRNYHGPQAWSPAQMQAH